MVYPSFWRLAISGKSCSEHMVFRRILWARLELIGGFGHHHGNYVHTLPFPWECSILQSPLRVGRNGASPKLATWWGCQDHFEILED